MRPIEGFISSNPHICTSVDTLSIVSKFLSQSSSISLILHRKFLFHCTVTLNIITERRPARVSGYSVVVVINDI